MKTVLLSAVAASICAITALASPTEFQCLIVCVEPDQHDPKALSSCNCAERYCPVPQGPGGPNIPYGDVWGWDESINACGPVPDGDQCAGLDVTCVPGYTYGWNGVDTCQCLPLLPKRQEICDIICVLPEAYDPHAVSPACNCAERVCRPGPECPAGTSFGWDEATNACGCTPSPEAQCLATGFTCVTGFRYGWDAIDATCKCLAVTSKRQAENTL